MLGFVLFCVPFLPALFLTLGLTRAHGLRGSLWAVLAGIGIAICFVVFAATKGWLGTGEAMCGSDGCWIDSMRGAVEAVVGVSLGLWLLGVGVGLAVSYALGRWRRADPTYGGE